MAERIEIDYYSDVLCVWAWIAERRLQELNAQWGQRVQLRHHYINLFGDTVTRMSEQWADRGGFEGFGAHVREAAAPFEDATVNSQIWKSVRPASSATAHLVIKAAEVAFSRERGAALALAIRQAFFIDARDIGQLQVVLDVADENSLPSPALTDAIGSGEAVAALMTDYRRAEHNGVKGSPSWVMNEGRQTLYGNVGYRVLHGNIEELIRAPADEASWC